MVIHGKNIDIVLRSTIPDEVRQIAVMQEVAPNLTEKWTYPAGMPDKMIFVLNAGGEIAGQASLKSIRWFNRKAELSLFLHPKWQGKQLGTEVLRNLIAHAFFQLNLHRLEAEVIDYNQPARHLVEKLGFVLEGRLREARYFKGKYFDILRYGLLRREYESLISKEDNE